MKITINAIDCTESAEGCDEMRVVYCADLSSKYDMSKKSLAVVFSDGEGNGVVMWRAGGHFAIEADADLSSMEELQLYDCPLGIWVWEGIYKWYEDNHPEYGSEGGGSNPVGEYRSPTDEEWLAIRENRSPWNDADWMS